MCVFVVLLLSCFKGIWFIVEKWVIWFVVVLVNDGFEIDFFWMFWIVNVIFVRLFCKEL